MCSWLRAELGFLMSQSAQTPTNSSTETHWILSIFFFPQNNLLFCEPGALSSMHISWQGEGEQFKKDRKPRGQIYHIYSGNSFNSKLQSKYLFPRSTVTFDVCNHLEESRWSEFSPRRRLYIGRKNHVERKAPIPNPQWTLLSELGIFQIFKT